MDHWKSRFLLGNHHFQVSMLIFGGCIVKKCQATSYWLGPGCEWKPCQAPSGMRQACSTVKRKGGKRNNRSGTLQGINISHFGKRKIIFKMPFFGDMLIPWRVIFNHVVEMIGMECIIIQQKTQHMIICLDVNFCYCYTIWRGVPFHIWNVFGDDSM